MSTGVDENDYNTLSDNENHDASDSTDSSHERSVNDTGSLLNALQEEQVSMLECEKLDPERQSLSLVVNDISSPRHPLTPQSPQKSI